MTNVLKIPANSQAYLIATRDITQDKFDVRKFAYDFKNAVVFPEPWAYWKMEEDGCADRVDATGNGHELVPLGGAMWPTSNQTGYGYAYLDFYGMTFVHWTAKLIYSIDSSVLYEVGGSGAPSWDIPVSIPLHDGYDSGDYYSAQITIEYWNPDDLVEFTFGLGSIDHQTWGTSYPLLKRYRAGAGGTPGIKYLDYSILTSTRWAGEVESTSGHVRVKATYPIIGELRYKPSNVCPSTIGGKSGDALWLDWEDRFIDGSESMPVWTEDPRFTFAFWVYMASDPDSYGVEFNFGTESNDVNVHAYGDDGYGYDFDANVPGLYVETSGDGDYASGWHFICLYYDGTGLYLEIDNALADSDLGAWDDIGVDLGPYSIWPWVDHSKGYDSGHGVGFDEVGIWLVALTESQRTYLWNSGAGRTLYP